MAPVNSDRHGLLLAAILVSGGCGTTGDVTALPDHWPRAGLSGYVLRNPDAASLLSLAGFDLDEPTVQTGPAAGLTLWGRMAKTAAPQQSQLFRAELGSLDGSGDVAVEVGLTATEPWEGQGLHGATWLAGSDPPLLIYQGEDGSVGLARLAGTAVQKLTQAAPLIAAAQLGGGGSVGRVAAALRPAAAGDRLRLYYTVDEAEVYSASTAAAAVQGLADGQPVASDWQVAPTGLMAAAFQVPPGDPKALPADRIAGLGVRRTITPIGRERWDLFVVASSGKKSALVAASAYGQSDGREQFATVAAPLFKSADGAPLSPTVTTWQGQPLLLCGLHQVQTVIVAAVQPQ
jgi:hypothetical protein